MKILLADDEVSIQKLISGLLEGEGHECVCVEDGTDALEAFEGNAFDLVILDVMMPRMDGFATCRELRTRGVTVPVIFLSAKGDIVDKGIGFAAGGDDYMTKPFDPRELLMHIEAHLRRAHMDAAPARPEPKTLTLGRFVMDTAKHQVTKDGIPIKLTPKEFKILLALARTPDTVLSKEQLVEEAWGAEFVGETQSITVFIKKLRNKIEDDPSDPRIIETVWGIGYRLVEAAC
ncbi:response regulator transcription factor [uncultured Slackia sp.]|uniref:response regulator transcription factor n=1 Tax=uncultured Slackia sp. TaxID=665903 RepID=UPI00258EA075|nr:response regulator transcription factor [uncultured Slackia sp.]